MNGTPALLLALGLFGVVFALVVFVILYIGGGLYLTDLLWIFGNLGLGVVLIVSAAAINLDALRSRLSSGETRRAGRFGASSVLNTVLGIAILGMLGFFGTRYNERFDFSEAGVHSLSDQSVQ